MGFNTVVLPENRPRHMSSVFSGSKKHRLCSRRTASPRFRPAPPRPAPPRRRAPPCPAAPAGCLGFGFGKSNIIFSRPRRNVQGCCLWCSGPPSPTPLHVPMGCRGLGFDKFRRTWELIHPCSRRVVQAGSPYCLKGENKSSGPRRTSPARLCPDLLS